MNDIDLVDKKLLCLLQENSDLSLNELAEAVNLTTTPCWKRIKKLEKLGILRQRVALLHPQKLGFSFIAFVYIKTSNHSVKWYDHFTDTVSSFAEVMEFYRMAGEYDYMMKIMVANMEAFDLLYKKLVKSIDGLIDVNSAFAMEQLKYTTALPL